MLRNNADARRCLYFELGLPAVLTTIQALDLPQVVLWQTERAFFGREQLYDIRRRTFFESLSKRLLRRVASQRIFV